MVLEVLEVHHHLVVLSNPLALVVPVALTVLAVLAAQDVVVDQEEDEVELKPLCPEETGLVDCLEDLEILRLKPMFLADLEWWLTENVHAAQPWHLRSD